MSLPAPADPAARHVKPRVGLQRRKPRRARPGQDHGRAAEWGGEGKNRSPVKTCIASSAENRIAPASITKPTIRSARADAAAMRACAAIASAAAACNRSHSAPRCASSPPFLMHASRRQGHAGRAHQRGDAGENERRAGHLWLHRRRGRPARAKQSLGPALVKTVRTIDPWDR